MDPNVCLKAASENDYLILGDCYCNGAGPLFKQNYDKAFKFYKKEYDETKSPSALAEIGRMQLTGHGLLKPYPEKAWETLGSALSDDPKNSRANYAWGMMFSPRNSLGFMNMKDKERARQFYFDAATGPEPLQHARYNLAHYYAFSAKPPQPELAYKWMQAAMNKIDKIDDLDLAPVARIEDSKNYSLLGYFAINGIGGPINPDDAIWNIKRALAIKSSTYDYNNLGYAYFHYGENSKGPDPVKARKCYEDMYSLSVHHSSEWAEALVGIAMTYEGTDPKHALNLYEEAKEYLPEKDHDLWLYRHGRLYHDTDPQKAFGYYAQVLNSKDENIRRAANYHSGDLANSSLEISLPKDWVALRDPVMDFFCNACETDEDCEEMRKAVDNKPINVRSWMKWFPRTLAQEYPPQIRNFGPTKMREIKKIL